VVSSKFNNIDNDLLNWTHPRETGIVLGLINLVFFTMIISSHNFFTLVTYFFLLYLIVGIFIGKFMEPTSKEYIYSNSSDNEYEHVSKDCVEKIMKIYYSTALKIENFMKRVVSFKELELTIKVII
jgi:hypothetical protein